MPAIEFMRAAFLDRDGVVNVDKGYVHRWDDFEFVPGALAGMRRLSEVGYRIVIVTNQSGIARGLFTEEQYQLLTGRLIETLKFERVDLAGVYHCPHHPCGVVRSLSMACDCRKPMPGLIQRAAREHGFSLSGSILVGDRLSDIHAAQSAGVGRAFLVGSSVPDGCGSGGFQCFASLAACAKSIAPLV